MDCIKFTISKGIGLAIVMGSAILKLPQIIKILSNSSVEGISAMTYYLETICFMQTAGQAMAQGIPFSVYGESLIIMVQNFLITLMIWHYNKTIATSEKILVAALGGAYAFALFSPGIISSEYWKLISSSNTMLNIAAKLPQIYTNFKMKSTGQMAFFTFLLSFLGSLARTATVLFESDDFFFRLQFLTAVALNTMIITQFGLYWNTAKKVDVAPLRKKDKNKLE